MNEYIVYVEATLEVTVFAENAEEAEERAGTKLVYGDSYITNIRSAFAEKTV